ncbi:MAG: phage portal protein [Calditrichaeota bacterium]|nr:phage portal protein [Calditrichota bacterium]
MQWFLEWAGGGKTASGIDINPENAISLTTVFNAITLISEGMAMMPFAPHIEENINGRVNKRIYKEHFSYPLVARRSHPYISSYNFRKVMFAWACRYDDAYAFISRKGSGNAISMYPIHPNRVVPMITPDRRLIYEIDGKEKIDYINMFHIVGYTNNGITGSSRVHLAKEALGKAMAAQQFGAKFFGKGMNVSGFVKTPKLLKDKDAVDRLKQSFIKAHGGQNNQFGIGVLEDGADWISNEVDPEKAQLNETIKVDGLMVAQLFNIPLTMLKFLERGTAYANVEQLAIQFVKYTMVPWGVNWEQECWEKLLTEREKEQDKIRYKFNFNGLLRGDTQTRAQFYNILSKCGAYSPNRILELEDENGYEGGDVHPLSPGTTTIEQLENETQNTTS